MSGGAAIKQLQRFPWKRSRLEGLKNKLCEGVSSEYNHVWGPRTLMTVGVC